MNSRTPSHAAKKPTRKPKRSRKTKKPEKWIQKAHLKKGALRKRLHVPEGQVIPVHRLKWASKQPGTLGKEARLALTFRGFSKAKMNKFNRVLK